ncbi:hypothetical protein HZC20_04010 [Candidatus Peregrinibacteria bacterium]|nr:hypothetical protein [Candidatus Peregrinibacteria bacterium]
MKSNTKLIKQILIVFALMVGAITLFTFMSTSYAAVISPTDNPSELGNVTGNEGSIRKLVLRIVNYFLGFLGILAVIMVIYGGVTYVTSAGNDEGVGNAKKIILYSLVGIIIILLAFAIVNTVLSSGSAVQPAA